MLNFLRKLRHNNMNGKYLKYAIGEIVLVVIGILIALQINNLNDDRKQNIKEQYTLEQLRIEFQADSIKLNQIMLLTKGKIANESAMLRAISEQKTNVLSLSPIFFTGKAIPFYDYSPTYDELTSSGNLNIISNDNIKNAINDFANHNSLVETTIYPDLIEKKHEYMNHVYKYFNGEINGLIWGRNNQTDNLEALGADYKGFVNDPLTVYHLNKVLAADSEFLYIGQSNISAKLNMVLTLLNKEIASHD